MKIKQSTFYAFRIMYRLDEAGSRVVTSREIAEKEDYSAGMVLKLLCALKKGGLVSAHQGRGQASGGFRLEKDIDEITILEIVRIMEGVDICANFDETLRQKGTQMTLICSRLNEELAELLSSYTVRDLFEFDRTGDHLDTGGGKKVGRQRTDPLKIYQSYQLGPGLTYAGNRIRYAEESHSRHIRPGLNYAGNKIRRWDDSRKGSGRNLTDDIEISQIEGGRERRCKEKSN